MSTFFLMIELTILSYLSQKQKEKKEKTQQGKQIIKAGFSLRAFLNSVNLRFMSMLHRGYRGQSAGYSI